MTKKERLHWFYTAILIVFIAALGNIITTRISVSIAISGMERKAREVSKEEIKTYHEEIWKIKFKQDSIKYIRDSIDHDRQFKISEKTYEKLK